MAALRKYKVAGRSVLINEKTYQIAGIQYQEEELCVYELTPDTGQEAAFAAMQYDKREQKDMGKRRIENAVRSRTLIPVNEGNLMAAISLSNVKKIYPNGYEAVKDFNLDIEDKVNLLSLWVRPAVENLRRSV